MIFLNFKKWIGNAPRSRRRVAQLIFEPHAPHSPSVGRNARRCFVRGFEGEGWRESARQPRIACADRPPALGTAGGCRGTCFINIL